MKVLIIGEGGREHALAWKIALSNSVDHVFVAPGNAGTALEESMTNIPIEPGDFKSLSKFAIEENINLTIVGPETPLVNGIVDFFQKKGLNIFGPSQQASQLEGSKSYCKDFLMRHEIPTASYASFSNMSEALDFLQTQSFPIVIKADGLAAGKGVIIAQTQAEAQEAVKGMMSGELFASAGESIVIEDYLDGEEASFICLVCNDVIVPMATSQDHKARDNGGLGPNTGGMGAYSPAPVVTDEIYDYVIQDIIEPTVFGMKKDGVPYTGFLYAGLIIGNDGSINVLEYNCRLGDPETQPIMMRLVSDIAEICFDAASGILENTVLKWDKRSSLGVVLASDGYPSKYEVGKKISGLRQGDVDDVKVFHAGTSSKEDEIITNGGRVLCVTALGNNVGDAKQKAYQRVAEISWDGLYMRSDIGDKCK